MKEQIRDLVLSQGADVCGFADIERFSDAPKGFHPKDIFKTCKSIIVFGIALPKGVTNNESRLIYSYFNNFTCSQVDLIAFKTAKEIEKLYGSHAVPIPCDDPYEYWIPEKLEGRGLISMKHAAVLCGLGTMGKNTLFLNKEYGNMLTLGAVLTELELGYDPLTENICIDGCDLCIKSCPVHAIENNTVDQAKCRTNTYVKNAKGTVVVNCNKCRTVCPMRFGKK